MMKNSFVAVMGMALLGFLAPGRAEDSTAAPAAPAAPATPAAETAKDITIEKISFAAGVENREPTGESSQFDPTVERVFCWTKVSAKNVPAKIHHVWYMDGKKVADIALDIKYPTMRTWSNHGVTAGAWKVDVTDDGGNLLSSASFTLTKRSERP